MFAEKTAIAAMASIMGRMAAATANAAHRRREDGNFIPQNHASAIAPVPAKAAKVADSRKLLKLPNTNSLISTPQPLCTTCPAKLSCDMRHECLETGASRSPPPTRSCRCTPDGSTHGTCPRTSSPLYSRRLLEDIVKCCSTILFFSYGNYTKGTFAVSMPLHQQALTFLLPERLCLNAWKNQRR